MTRAEFQKLLEKHLRGTATPAEKELLDKVSDHFYQKNQERTFSSEEEKSEVFHELYSRIRPSSGKPGFRSLKIAASVLLLVSLGVLSWLLLNEPLKIHTTSAGERSTITLNEGTTVQLNAKSSLHYPEKFEGKKRTVKLKGEAYLQVAKDTSKPFTIKANGIETTVLGTAFNISAYPEDSTITVSLVEGSVKVQGEHQNAILKPGRQARFGKNGKLKVQSFNPENTLAWRQNRLVFQKITYKHLAKILKRQYDITLIFEESHFKSFTISGHFEQPELSEILSSVTLAKGLEYKETSPEKYLIYKP